MLYVKGLLKVEISGRASVQRHWVRLIAKCWKVPVVGDPKLLDGEFIDVHACISKYRV